MRQPFALMVIAIAALSACGSGAGNNEPENSMTNAANADDADNADSNDSNATEPSEAGVEDGPGGETDCPTGAGGEVPDFGDVLAVEVVYDGASTATMTIEFAGEAQAKMAEMDGTTYSGYVQTEIGTVYPFAAGASGDFEASPSSLAESFDIRWNSPTEAVVTIGGFEEGGGPITKAEVNTVSPAQDPDNPWCDNVTVDL